MSATACFRQYLAKGGGRDLKTIDVDALRCKAIGLKSGEQDAAPTSPPIDAQSCDPVLLVCKGIWAAGLSNEAERTSHVRVRF